MSSLGSPNPFFIAGKKAYEVERSLRFNDDDSVYLNRTPSSTSNRKTFTISLWVKRGNLDNGGIPQALFGAYDNSTSGNDGYYFSASLDSGGVLAVGAWSQNWRVTSKLFRDTSAWYHIVVAIDTTQSTADNRVRIYVNGTEETSFSTKNNPSQNYDLGWNFNAQMHTIGRVNYTSGTGPYHYDGYIAEFNSIDGFQYDPSYFGKTDPITGQWNPKKYTGGYGTNGFYLNFSDNSGTTATTLGKDYSGNGNNFTPNNFSVAAGVGNDSLEDTPTNNFCTLNAVAKGSGVSLSQGNLGYNSSGREGVVGTFAVRSGKWYWEVTASDVGADTQVGIYDNTDGKGFPTSYLGVNTSSWGVISSTGTTIHNTSQASYGSSFSDGDILMVALDMDNGKWYLGKNGSWYNSGNPASSTNPAHSGITSGTGLISPAISNNTENNMDYQFNFGQRAFSYTAPTGYKALNSANLPDPTILLPNKHFDTLLYTGNGSTNAITGLNYQPDWVWLKRRNGSNSHQAFDSVRGAGKNIRPDTTAAEATTTAFNSFDSNGFELDGTSNNNNGNGNTYVAWNWNVGDTDGKTYTVTVVDDSGNKYRFDGFGTSAVTLDLAEGGTYIFNYPSAHPFRFSETADGTHGGGSEYTTGVTVLSSTSIQIVVAASAPNLNYYCSSHSGMGGAINTNSTLGSSNFDGSVQSIVKVNATAGISITRYTGTGSSITIGHGLGVTPQVTMTKALTTTSNWTFLHTVYDGSYDRLYLNTSAAYANSGIPAPTSTVFSRTASDTNNRGMICYSFSSVEGYSKISYYVGNGSSDGTFVYCGFRPAWIMIKGRTGTRNWFIKDIKRDPFNLTENALFPNSNATENTTSSYDLDILSNGFKIRNSNTQSNQNDIVYIFMAYAELPFKNARAR